MEKNQITTYPLSATNVKIKSALNDLNTETP